MMQAVLYVGHGSRVDEACEQAVSFIEKCMNTISAPIQEIGFLELASPTIDDGIRRCVERGATRIAVLPLLLLTAGHAKKDIPLELEKIKEQYPDITIDYGRPLGVHEEIVDILIERIREKQETIGGDTRVLLVGRGSSDPDTTRDLGHIARLLSRKHPFQSVQTAYLTSAKPSFEEGLEQAQVAGNQQVFVLPYLLFTGILMKSMRKKIDEINTADQQFTLCEYLGYHPNLSKVVKARVEELIGSTGEEDHEQLPNYA
jgi:sirohydrochlorin ferrochelatase